MINRRCAPEDACLLDTAKVDCMLPIFQCILEVALNWLWQLFEVIFCEWPTHQLACANRLPITCTKTSSQYQKLQINRIIRVCGPVLAMTSSTLAAIARPKEKLVSESTNANADRSRRSRLFNILLGLKWESLAIQFTRLFPHLATRRSTGCRCDWRNWLVLPRLSASRGARVLLHSGD